MRLMIKRMRVWTLGALLLLSGSEAAAIDYDSPNQMNYNRSAQQLHWYQLWALNGAHTGFQWNSGDNQTKYWRPQGITGYVEGNKKYLIVSWAGQEHGDYDQNRGVRVSVLDVTSMSSVKYRHVLLVTANDDVFSGMHAGGIHAKGDTLYVADSRSPYRIRKFDLSRIVDLNSQSYLGYRYLLRESGSFKVVTKPSFLSFDWTRNKFITGSFANSEAHDVSGGESKDAGAKLHWFGTSSEASDANLQHSNFYPQMQGAVSENNYLWSTHSYGRSNRSHLHVDCYSPGDSTGYKRRWSYPPGLEDMHRSLTSDNLWMLTEFGPHEAGNNRIVFATDSDLLKPSGGC